MSLEKSNIKKDHGLNLVTVGRLTIQKGYDIAIDAARILKEKNLIFKWYFIGEGPERIKLEKMIEEYYLQDNVILKGMQINPYKYINDADIYVQTSRFEGYCITLAEARMLDKPIVTTDFDVVHDQIKHEENGLIVEMNPESIVDAIIKLVEDRNLTTYIISNLKKEKKGNVEEIKKFYKIIEEN